MSCNTTYGKKRISVPQQCFRIRFSKLDRLKFIGHIDLLRTLESLFRRARLPIAMSCGFHPKLRMSFPSALALGFESLDEVLELTMNDGTERFDADDLLVLLNNHTLEGLHFHSARLLQDREKKAQLASSVFQMPIPAEFRERVADGIKTFMAKTSFMISKTKGKSSGKAVDVRRAVLQMSLDEAAGELTVELQPQTGPEAGIKEVLTALGLDGELFKTIFPKRICCRLIGETY